MAQAPKNYQVMTATAPQLSVPWRIREFTFTCHRPPLQLDPYLIFFFPFSADRRSRVRFPLPAHWHTQTPSAIRIPKHIATARTFKFLPRIGVTPLLTLPLSFPPPTVTARWIR